MYIVYFSFLFSKIFMSKRASASATHIIGHRPKFLTWTFVGQLDRGICVIFFFFYKCVIDSLGQLACKTFRLIFTFHCYQCFGALAKLQLGGDELINFIFIFFNFYKYKGTITIEQEITRYREEWELFRHIREQDLIRYI